MDNRLVFVSMRPINIHHYSESDIVLIIDIMKICRLQTLLHTVTLTLFSDKTLYEI